MNINIKATHLKLTGAIESTIAEKLETLEKFLKPEDKLQIEIEVDKKHKSGEIFRAEVTIKPQGHYAEARGTELYEAIDLMMPKIKEQLTKAKDKKVSLRRQRGAGLKGK